MVHAIGQGHSGYKTRHPHSLTQKTTCPAQTKHHSQCQKETQVHDPYDPVEQCRVGERVALFRERGPETLGHPLLSYQAQNQTESQRGSQKESRRSGQESLGLEIVENPLTWDGLVNVVLRPASDDDDARNVAASYLMCKTSSTRQA